MADNRGCSNVGGTSIGRDTVCIDTNRVLDSCRDKDCFEDVKVYLTGCGQDVVDKSCSARVKDACLTGADVSIEPIQFNRGFYTVKVRYYVKCYCECCTGVCGQNKVIPVEGIAVCEKKAILYGGEGCVNIFRSDGVGGFCTSNTQGDPANNLPTAIVETVDPVVLDVKITEKPCECCHCCCCCVAEIPDPITCGVSGALVDSTDADRNLYITLGFFSVIRIVRPGQYLVNAAEYSVPDKVCKALDTENPCALFEKMAFPVSDFTPCNTKQIGCNT